MNSDTSSQSAIPTIDQLNSEEVHRVLPTIIYLALLIVTGTIGNLIVIAVYTTKYGPSNTKYFIVCLAVIDLFTCCAVIPLEITTMTMQLTLEHVWLCKASRFSNSASTLWSAALLVVISVDRYRKMCKPFGWQITQKSARVMCAVVILVGLLLSWPALFIYGRVTVNLEQYNLTGNDCSISDSMEGTIFPLLSSVVLLGCFIFGTSTVLILYCCIGSALHKHAKRMPRDFRAISKNSLRKEGSVSCVSESDIYVEMNPNGEVNTTPSEENEHSKGNNQIESSLDNFDEISMDNNYTITKDGITSKTTSSEEHETKTSSHERSIHSTSENGCVKTKAMKENGDPHSPVLSSRHSNWRSDSLTSSISSVNSPPSRSALSKYSKQSTNIRKTSILMLIISVTFTVSYLPHLLLMLTREVNEGFVDGLTDSGRAAYKFFLRSYFLNCTTNPVIYCIYGSHFRAVCKTLLVSVCRRVKMTFK